MPGLMSGCGAERVVIFQVFRGVCGKGMRAPVPILGSMCVKGLEICLGIEQRMYCCTKVFAQKEEQLRISR